MLILGGTEASPEIISLTDDEYDAQFPSYAYSHVRKPRFKEFCALNQYIILSAAAHSDLLCDIEAKEVRGFDIENLFEMLQLVEPENYVFLESIHYDRGDFIALYYPIEHTKPNANFQSYIRKQKLKKYIQVD